MNTNKWLIKVPGLITLLLITLSCSLTSRIQQYAQELSPGANTTTKTGDLLLKPAIGLDQLPGYKVTLKQDLAGTLDGQPYERHNVYELSKQPGSGAFDYSNTVSGTDTRSFSLRFISLDGAFYQWEQSQSDCQGSNTSPTDNPVTEPASLLIPVNNGDFVGKEKVNGIDSSHYTFDRGSLPLGKGSENVTGELWIADDGGYVIKYLLNVALPEKITGKDLEIAQTWVYQLELLDQTDAVSLPAGCRPVPVEITPLEGSTNITYASGSLSFGTSSGAGEVVDFYNNQLSTLGWQPPENKPGTKITAPFLMDFRKGNQVLTLLLSKTEDNPLNVELQVSSIPEVNAKSEPGLDSTPTGEPGPEPTIDPAESGLPEDIPLYPGSTGLMKTSEVVMFITPDQIDLVTSYYRQQLISNEWTLTNDISVANTVTQMWSKNNTEMTISFVLEDGKTRIVISLPK
jgi:hypothetical protein